MAVPMVVVKLVVMVVTLLALQHRHRQVVQPDSEARWAAIGSVLQQHLVSGLQPAIQQGIL